MSDLPDNDAAHPRPVIDHEPEPPTAPQQSAATGAGPAGREPPHVGAPPPASAPPPPSRRGGTPFAITLLFTAALAGGIYYTWTHPRPDQQQPDAIQAIDAAKSALQQQLAGLDARVGKLEALEPRVASLEQHASAAPAPAAAPAPDQASGDLAKRMDDLAAHLNALSEQQEAQNAAIEKLAQAGQAPPAPQAAAPETPPRRPAEPQNDEALNAARQLVADLGQKLDQALTAEKTSLTDLTGRLQKLEQADQAAHAAQDNAQQNAHAIATLDNRVQTLEKGEGQLATVKHDATLAVKLAAAQAALANGQPLGELPGAPGPLARFAKAPPPTESQLKSEFPAVTAKALAASRPVEQQHNFLGRVLARVEQSVTIRQGDQVIVGDPAAGVLARAQQALDDDDLRGAVHDLAALTGPAADAVQPWVTRAKALIDAREALAAMAHS